MRKAVFAILVAGAVATPAMAAILIGTGEYVANTNINPDDAYRFAKNKAIANASEQAVTLVESDRQLIKSTNGDWSRSEMRVLSSSLLKINSSQQTKENLSNDKIVYRVTISADFDEAHQQVIQQNMAQNEQLRQKLQDLSIAQAELLGAKEALSVANNKPKPTVSLSLVHYEQQFNDTKALIGVAQHSNLKMSLQTIEMRQAIEQARREKDAEMSRIQDEEGKVLANMRYISAQRIVRFVNEHLPLNIENIQTEKIGTDNVNVKYSIKWQMSSFDIQKTCDMFIAAGLAVRCRPSDDNSRISVIFKSELKAGYFWPTGSDSYVWENPILMVKDAKITNPITYTVKDKDNELEIRVANSLNFSRQENTKEINRKIDMGSDLIVGEWKK